MTEEKKIEEIEDLLEIKKNMRMYKESSYIINIFLDIVKIIKKMDSRLKKLEDKK
jgi:hypothetical protein